MKSKFQIPCLAGRQATCRFLFPIIIFILILDLVGCETIAKKFTRKRKTEDKVEELVLAPEEYKDTRPKIEIYRDYFDYWKSWQSELYESLLQKKSNKKQVDCADQAIKNLFSMRKMLNVDAQKKLDVYINRMKQLRDSIASDIYGNNSSTYMEKAEQLRMSIIKDFSCRKIQDYLI